MTKRRSEAVLVHPPEIAPEDFLHFYCLDGFEDDWKSLGLDDEDESNLWHLEILIMADPEGGVVIPGTGGLRKIRVGHPDSNIGKSGGCRVCYVYFPEHWSVLLVHAYYKKKKEDISPEFKRAIKQYIARAKQWFANNNY